jgi:4-amino-4-deoxy-L-arabinose transferase-like glycosyltransferase
MRSSFSSYGSHLLLVIILAAALTVPWLERPFHTRGEPREALVAQAMLETGDWISPPAYDGAVPSKPPFTHWLMAAVGMARGGVDEFSARLPAALAVISFAAFFFLFLHRRIGLERAFGASIVLLASSEWFRSASTCRVDTVLAVSMAGALLALYAWWEGGLRGVPWLAIVLTGCATLTKGPVGLVLPFAIFALFAWLQAGFGWRAFIRLAFKLTLLALPVVAIASSWYVLGYIKRGEPFIEKVMYENFDRFTSSMQDEPHKHSVFYLFGMLFIGVLPWSLLLLNRVSWISLRGVAVRAWWRDQAPLYRFAYLVTLTVLVFFCIPSSKRSVYLLPLYPFLALIIERWARKFGGALFERYLGRVVLGGVLALGLAAAVLFVAKVGGCRLEWGAFMASLASLKVLVSLVLVALLFSLARAALSDVWQRPLEQVGLSVIAAVFVVSFLIYDTLAWQLSPKRWLNSDEFNRAVAGQQGVTGYYSFGSEAYGASFYLAKRFNRITNGGVQDGALVFLEQRKLDQFRQEVTPNFRELFRYHSGVESERKAIVVLRTGGV